MGYDWDVFSWAAFRLVHRVHDVRCVRNVEGVVIEILIGIAVCGIWAFIGYLVGLDEGMKRRG